MQVDRCNAADGLLIAQHRPPQRLVEKSRLLEQVEDDIRCRVVCFRQLLKDDLLFELQMRGFEMRALNKVGQQLHAELEVRG